MSAHTSDRFYYWIFAWLMLLLIATAGLSWVPFKQWHWEAAAVVIALSIAIIKAALVVLFFMHIHGAHHVRKIFIFVGIGWFLILMTLTLNDYLTRGWEPMSQGWSSRAVIPRP